MNRPFLDKVAEYLYNNHSNDLGGVTVVLPNRRAGLFLKNYLAKYFSKTTWLPVIISSEEFSLKHSGLKKLDNISILLRFYEVYRSIEKENADNFDDFMLWAQVLVQDFNEVDQYLIDANDLFSFINDARALEVWNVDGSAITDTQRNYLEFWKRLPQYYHELRTLLKKNKECYQGMAFRKVAENINMLHLSGAFSGTQQFLFVGFNAFNQSEEKIVDYLLRERLANVLWDADSYYLNDKTQEAGLFLRRLKKKWDFKEFHWISNNWLEGEKTITITGINGNVNQANYSGDILNALRSEQGFQNTALVLADEMLLDPVLQALPDTVEHVNITMGYALENSPMHSLWMALIKMHENSLKYSVNQSVSTYHFKDVIRLLNHPFIKSKEVGKIVNYIVKHNWVFIASHKIIELVQETNTGLLFDICFKKWEDDPVIALDQLKLLVSYYKTKWEKESSSQLQLEYLHLYDKIIRHLAQVLIENEGIILNIKTIKHLFSQLISKETVDFYGEPLKGLQLMGMLETRTLDFENIILLSSNEGTIPSGKSSQSFIPYEIKRKYKLPTHIEKDALFAYHFYKLLQRAKNIHLVYNTDVDGFSGSEKSRFITQLLYEIPKVNKKIKFIEQQLSFDIKVDEHIVNEIAKSEEVLLNLKSYFEKGVSPSALNTYVNCSLDFYYKYILKLREKDEVEENIEASTMGDVIHKVLEHIYIPFVKKVVRPNDLKPELNKVERRVTEVFKLNNFTENELKFGKNYLTLKVIVKFITDFLQNEIKFIEKLNKEGQELTILDLERELSMELDVNGIKVMVRGVADRIDKIGDAVRIIDYKSGVVERKNLCVPDLESLTADLKYSKCLQLMLYGMMYSETFNDDKIKIVPGIISFRKLSEGFMALEVDKNSFSIDQLVDFKALLRELIASMMDVDQSFVHDKNASYCNFCDI